MASRRAQRATRSGGPKDCRSCVLSLEELEKRCVLSSITDLGVLTGGSYSIANAINANGDAVGYSDVVVDGAHYEHAFIYTNGVMTDLGTLLGSPDHGASHALGINSNRAIVGDSVISDGTMHAFLKPFGQRMIDLGTISSITGNSQGIAINDNGVVVGKSIYPAATQDAHPGYHAFRYDGTLPIQDLGALTTGAKDGSYATAIDNATNPKIVGAAQRVTYPPDCVQGNFHAAQWQSGSTIVDLGTLTGGHESHAFGINASGYVVGDSSNGEDPLHCFNSPPHAFLINSSGIQQIDTNPVGFTISQSRALSINSSSTVVGNYSATGGDSNFTDAFIWDNTLHIRKLISLVSGSGWSQMIAATGINDSGWIVGQGVNASGASHAFLITPGTGPSTAGQDKTPPPPDPASTAASASAALPPADCGCQARHATQLALAALTPAAAAPSGLPSSSPGRANALDAPAALAQELPGPAESTPPVGTASPALPVGQESPATDLFSTASGSEWTGLWPADYTAGLPGPLA